MAKDLKAQALQALAGSRAQADPDYPRYHLAPAVGRLNDPNGLLVDRGTYHAFFQLGPFHPQRRLVYWGHASSTDLLSWRQHEPAIAPDSAYDANGAYSGTALVLEPEEAARAPQEAPFQLFYTGNLKDPRTSERHASQCLVSSADLRTFAKHPGNPVVPQPEPGFTAHYRDPQVFRDPDRPGEYRMLVGAQRADRTGAAVLYRSRDLLEWTFEGELVFPDAGGALDRLGYMWECPNLVRLTDEQTGQQRDVLVFCPQGMEPQAEGYENVFPCVYVVGRLEGCALRECDGTLAELDRGFEFYAPQVFARRPSEPGPVLLMGWAGNATEDEHPSLDPGGWLHTMTVPRVLSLRGGRLLQRPTVPTQAPGAVRSVLAGTCLPAGSHRLPELEGSRHWQLVLEPAPGARPAWTLRLGTEGCHVDITLDGDQLTVDRSTSRLTRYATRRQVTLPAGAADRLEVLHDASVTELYLGQGELVLTLRSFLEPRASGATLLTPSGLEVAAAWVRLHSAAG